MKKCLFLLAFIVGLFACNKTQSDDSSLLIGSWKMVTVQDKGSLVLVTKPSNTKDVTITFEGGKLSGRTPSNDIWPSDYTTGPGNQLSVPAIAATKVGEDGWGALFYLNMYFIESYSFKKSNSLSIVTKEKILGFERL